MAYAKVTDVQERMTRTLNSDELKVCKALLDDAAAIIDSYNTDANDNVKKAVSCRMCARALGDGQDVGIPMGATQGSISALGYAQSWTIGSGGAAGEIYLSRAEKKMLGIGNAIGSHSPIEDKVCRRL